MVDLPRKIAAETENVEKTLGNLKEAAERKLKSTVELAAMAAFLHNIYNGIENILKQIHKAQGTSIPKSKMWHKELLESSASMGIISEELSDELFEYLTFRHFFVHAYGFMLEEAHLASLTNEIPGVWARFLSAIERYRRPSTGTA